MSNPCLTCGTPTSNGPRCPAHTIRRAPGYRQRAAAVVAQAYANSDTVCQRCGHSARRGDPWEAGHLDPTDPTEPLGPEHRSCNRRAQSQPI